MTDFTLGPEKGFSDYLQVLVRRRWVILSFFIICFTTVALGTFLMTPLYRAETKIIIEGENANILRAEESAAQGVPVDIFENYLETQMALIKSDSIAGKVFDEFGLSETPRYARGKDGQPKLFQKKFADDIYLERLVGTRMVLVAVENPNAKVAADIANRLAEIYSQDNLSRRALTFIRNQRMAALNSQYLDLQSRLDGLSKQFGPKHPQMIELREEIRALTKRIEDVRFAGEKGAPQPVSNPTGIVLTEEQKMLEDSLLSIQENSVLSSSKMNNINIVDRAGEPKKIAKPKRILNLVLGFLMGLIGGVLLAFLVDAIDDSVKTEEELKRYIGKVPFLGAIPSEGSLHHPHKGIERAVAFRPESPFAEAYRLVRTRLLWSLPKETHIKDIAVLSPGPSEGKTTVSSNLAIALAQLNHKVLLVDTDIRRGRVHEFYNLSNENGLGQYLSENISLDQVIQKTDIQNLSFVTCGKSVIDPSQLMGSHRMEHFIKETRARFDYIIYDTPPITMIADTGILIPQLGACVLTLRAGLTSGKLAQKAIAIAQESHAHLLGVLLNASETVNPPYYNKYYKR
jgi:capsular exopolysaccharide synthesis family protein